MAGYVLPAMLVWSLLGLFIHSLALLPLIVVSVGLLYALLYGVIEAFGLPVRAPSLTWQVPQTWVKERSPTARAMIWGVSLGPGLITRNPYAGMWLLLPLIALSPGLLAAALVGAFHGASRAVAILRTRHYLGQDNGHLLMMGSQLRWRLIDGFVLLFASGVLMAYAILLIAPGS